MVITSIKMFGNFDLVFQRSNSPRCLSYLCITFILKYCSWVAFMKCCLHFGLFSASSLEKRHIYLTTLLVFLKGFNNLELSSNSNCLVVTLELSLEALICSTWISLEISAYCVHRERHLFNITMSC